MKMVAEGMVAVAEGPSLVIVTVVVVPALHDEAEPRPLAVTMMVAAGQVVPETTVALRT
jgi:hypothetical protein